MHAVSTIRKQKGTGGKTMHAVSTIRTAFVAGAVAVMGALAGPVVAAEVPESHEPIKLAINEWTGQHITTHVAGTILRRMGYNVEYVTAGYQPQMIALEDNTITATLEIWSSNIGEHYAKAIASGKVEEIGDLGLKPVETWFYPSYLADKCPGLPDWKALNACAELFAVAETFPKGRLLDYPADWGTSNVDRIAALKLDFDVVPSGGEGALVAEIKSATARNNPLLVQFWSPHWLFAEVDLVPVTLPPYLDGCYEDPKVSINPDATYDCDWKRGYIKKLAWVGMKDKWPAAYKLLRNYQLRNADQIPMMKAIDQEGRDIRLVVAEWVEANEARWRPWVNDAMM